MQTESRTFRALHQVAVASGGLRDSAALAALVVDRARDLLQADAAALYWYFPDADELRTLAHNDPVETEPEPPLAPSEGAAGRAFTTGKGVRVDDYQRWDQAISSSRRRGILSGLAVPLLVGDRPVGALGVFTRRTRAWLDSEEDLLTLLAAQVAPALEAARLTEEASRQAATFRALHEVAVAAGGARGLPELGRLVADRCRQLFDVRVATLCWFDQADSRLRVLASSSGDPAADASADSLAVAPTAGVLGRAFSGNAPVLVSDYASSGLGLDWGHRQGIRSALAVPIVALDEPLGAIGVASTEAREFTPDDVQLLALLAAQVGPALRSARLYAESERRRQEAEALAELVRRGATLTDLESAGRLIAEHACRLLRADYAVAATAQEDALRIAGAYGCRSEPRLGGPGVGHSSAVLQQRVTIVLDAEDIDAGDHPLHQAQGGRAALGTAIGREREDPLGTIVVGWRSAHPVTAAQVALLEAVAAYAATVLANATAHERERRLAGEAAARSAELAASEERFRSLYSMVACGVLVQGADGRVVDANPAAQEILGLSLAEMAGRPTDELWSAFSETGDPIPVGQRPTHRAAASTRPERAALIGVRRPDGALRWLQVDTIPVLDERSQVRQVVSSFIDITARKEAEDSRRAALDQLADSERKLRAIFDHAPIGLARVDLSGRVQEVNLALQAMLGYGGGELPGVSLAELLGIADEPAIEQLLSGGRDHFLGERAIQRRGGGAIWVVIKVELVRGASGEPVYLIGMVEDVSERKAQTRLLEYQALHDALTDLPNRTLLHDRLHRAILAAQREGRGLGLLLLDLNRFKDVNDTFGHQLGDALLQRVGPRLTGQLRESDTVARLGGDEFAVVLATAADQAGAVQAAERILRALEDPFLIEGQRLQVGASIGIAMMPEHGSDGATLMQRADAAMYVAKRNRSGFAVYSPRPGPGPGPAPP